MKKAMLFTVASERINLVKKVRDIYIESYKTLMKEIEDTKKWKDVLCSWIRIINTVKASILPKASYRFSVIPYQNPKGTFQRKRTNNPKMYMEPLKIPQIAGVVLRGGKIGSEIS